jgi:GNAT superfamily N-acetyltransferase
MNKTELHIEIAPSDLLYAPAIARFQVDMAMESEGYALDYGRTLKGVESVLQDDNKGRYVLAFIDSKPVASLMITREWSDWNCCWYLWIQSVYVSPDYRKKGIFMAMYEEVLKLAKSEGVSQVRLYVDKDNKKAQTVYQKAGMSECHYLMYEVEV